MEALATAVQCTVMSPPLMEILVGHITYCLLFRRCVLCCLGHVYSWLQLHKGRKEAAYVPGRVRDELVTAMLDAHAALGRHSTHLHHLTHGVVN
eukprot:3381850-Amphidinium_carterae.1